MSKDKKDLIPVTEGGFLVLADQESRELLAEAAPSPNDLNKLLVPSGTGGAAFVVETLEGEEFHKTLDVVVAHESPVERRFYATEVGDGESGPPHCSSPDSKSGFGVRDVDALQDADGDIEESGVEPSAQDCAECAFSKFGSSLKGGKGQACKQSQRLVVFTPDGLLPMVLQVPPTSLKALKRHKMQLLNGRKRMTGTVTRLSLAKQSGSTDYYSLEFAYVRDLADEERTALASVAKALTDAAQASA